MLTVQLSPDAPAVEIPRVVEAAGPAAIDQYVAADASARAAQVAALDAARVPTPAPADAAPPSTRGRKSTASTE